MIENDSEEIALVYQYPKDKVIQVSNTVGYLFKVINNISLCWVHKDHLTEVLGMRRNCISCNPTMFRLATEPQLEKWYG